MQTQRLTMSRIIDGVCHGTRSDPNCESPLAPGENPWSGGDNAAAVEAEMNAGSPASPWTYPDTPYSGSSPVDYYPTGVNDWFGSQSVDSPVYSPYYGDPNSPDVYWPTPPPSTPFYGGSSDSIYGEEPPPYEAPTPDGAQWDGAKWDYFFDNIPQPGWTDQQWENYLNDPSTQDESGYSSSTVYPNSSETYIDSPWFPTPTAPDSSYDTNNYSDNTWITQPPAPVDLRGGGPDSYGIGDWAFGLGKHKTKIWLVLQRNYSAVY